jgi:formylglycine-generating enzyme required for sulfatase activity
MDAPTRGLKPTAKFRPSLRDEEKRMSFTLEQIIELAAELRDAGFDAGPRQLIAAEDLMLALAASGASPGDPRRWRTLLAPIFCSTPAEQERFYLLFDRWLMRQPEWAALEPVSAATTADAPRRQWLRRPAAVVFACLLVSLAAFVWWLSLKTGYRLTGQITGSADGRPVAGAQIEFLDRQVVSGADGTFALDYQTSNYHRLFRAGRQSDLRVTHAEHEPYAALLPVHQPAPQTITLSTMRSGQQPRAPIVSSTVTLPNTDPAPPSRSEERDARWFRLLLAALPLLVFFVWIGRRWLRRRAMLRRLSVVGDPQLKSVRLKGAGEWLFQGPAFRRAAQELRRHRESAITDLDVDATVHETVDRGGLFTPRYGARRSSPEYLLLIDRAGPGDEQARFAEEMSLRLEAGGVYVDRYYFQNDPLTCRRRDPLSSVLTLGELAARHPDHHLVVFGDGAAFLSPITGEPERWLESLSAWPRRALLTPELSSGYREQALAENDLRVLPATEEGLAALAARAEAAPVTNGRKPARPFPRAILERPRRWLERNEPRPEAADELIRQLREYLDDRAWLWLAACAVYPALSWEITLYFGVELQGRTDDFASRLLSLVRLPWFRHGAMPDWLRLRLIESFTPEQESAVRRVVRTMLSSLDEKGEIELEIAEPEAEPGMLEWLKTKAASWRRRENLADLINNQPDESPLRDYVFLCFLSGQRPDRADRLAVSATDLLLHALFHDGQTALGLRVVSAGVAALIIALLVFVILDFDKGPYYLAALAAATVVLWLTLRARRKRRPPALPLTTPAQPNVVDLGNGVMLETVDLPGGEFRMGGERYDWEKPPHRVRVSPFAIGKYPITQSQWKAVMGENPSSFKGDDLPVENVSWNDVNEFIKRLNQKTGLQFRLPTEAEWEYAARAGSTTEYYFGNDEKQLGDYAWFSKNSGGATHPVGQKKPNDFGLFDMHGNVWEWCSDWYSDTYYEECKRQGTVEDPPGPGTGSYRVNRGGGWSDDAVYCRSAVRNYGAPGFRSVLLGFRLVRIGR